MTGDDNPQAQQFNQGFGGGFGGFPGGGGFGFEGINIEDLMNQGFFQQQGHPGGHQGHHQGHQGGRRRQRSYTVNLGGG